MCNNDHQYNQWSLSLVLCSYVLSTPWLWMWKCISHWMWKCILLQCKMSLSFDIHMWEKTEIICRILDFNALHNPLHPCKPSGESTNGIRFPHYDIDTLMGRWQCPPCLHIFILISSIFLAKTWSCDIHAEITDWK